jgi:hypothetical protein
MQQEQRFTRQDLSRYLRGCGWPCAPAIVVEIARENGAPEPLLARLATVPNRLYLSERDLAEELERAGAVARA